MRSDLQRLKRDTESGRTAVATVAEPVSASSVTAASPAPPLGGQASAVSAVTAKPHAVKWPILASVATVAVVLGVGAWLYFARKVQALTEKDTIVLGDFTNTTGDAIFDDTLKTALNVSLRQSPFLNDRHSYGLAHSSGHRTVSVFQRYNITDEDDKRAALAAAATYRDVQKKNVVAMSK